MGKNQLCHVTIRVPDINLMINNILILYYYPINNT